MLKDGTVRNDVTYLILRLIIFVNYFKLRTASIKKRSREPSTLKETLKTLPGNTNVD